MCHWAFLTFSKFLSRAPPQTSSFCILRRTGISHTVKGCSSQRRLWARRPLVLCSCLWQPSVQYNQPQSSSPHPQHFQTQRTSHPRRKASIWLVCLNANHCAKEHSVYILSMLTFPFILPIFWKENRFRLKRPRLQNQKVKVSCKYDQWTVCSS